MARNCLDILAKASLTTYVDPNCNQNHPENSYMNTNRQKNASGHDLDFWSMIMSSWVIAHCRKSVICIRLEIATDRIATSFLLNPEQMDAIQHLRKSIQTSILCVIRGPAALQWKFWTRICYTQSAHTLMWAYVYWWVQTVCARRDTSFMAHTFKVFHCNFYTQGVVCVETDWEMKILTIHF